jgi:hypothetical protein
MAMNFLRSIFDSLDPSKEGASIKYEHYLDIYHHYFVGIRHDPISILEIGVEKGGSLSMWDRYFTHPHTTIVGIDILPGCKVHEKGKIKVEIGDQSDPGFLGNVVGKHGRFDIIIDDASHKVADHILTFDHLFLDALKPKGMYFIEDTQTCYAVPPNEKTIIHKLKDIIDYVTSDLHGSQDSANFKYKLNVDSIHFYNSLLFIKKDKLHKQLIKSPGFNEVPYP